MRQAASHGEQQCLRLDKVKPLARDDTLPALNHAKAASHTATK